MLRAPHPSLSSFSSFQMTEGRYSLRPKLRLTPNSKISKSVLTNRKKRTQIASPSPPPAQSPTPPLPPQPDFTPARSPDVLMEFFEAVGDQSDAPPVSDSELEQLGGNDVLPDAAADLEYWLGPGASDDIASMCIDAELSPDEDFMRLSMDEELVDNAPDRIMSAPTPERHISPPAPPVRETSATIPNPFPPLNPYPKFTFPPPIATDQPISVHDALFSAHQRDSPVPMDDNHTTANPSVGGPFLPAGTVAEPVCSNMDDANYNLPADDEDPLFFPDSNGLDDSAKENSPRQSARRIPKANWDALNAGFRKIDTLIDDLVNKTGCTEENIISLWRRSHAHECSRSVWNKYQRYFLENRRLERQRIDNPKANCKTCWEGFKRLEPKWCEILDAHDEMLTASDTRSTISSRTRKFDTLVGKLQSLTTNASEKDGFESMVVVCGNSIHEDARLSHVFVSAGAEKFVEQHLRFDDNTLSGLFQNHVCNRVSEGLETRLEMDANTSGMTATYPSKNSRKRDHKDESVLSVDDEGGSKSSGLSVMDAKAIIKAGFKDVLEPFSLDLSFEEIPWARLAGSLAPAGLMIENWPRGIGFPTAAPPRREVAPGATVVRKRNTSQGIKDLGYPGIRALAESFSSDATRIRVVHASAHLLTTSQIPLYVEALPGPGSPAVIHHALANGWMDCIKVKNSNATSTLPPVPEVIEITSSSPSSADAMNPPCHHRSKKAKTPDSDDQPLKRARKRTANKSKPVISDSEEISDADDDQEPAVVKKVKVAVKATTKASKGKGKAVDGKGSRAAIDVDAEWGAEVTRSAATSSTAQRKPVGAPPMTEANMSKAPPSTKLVPKPHSELFAAALTRAAVTATAALRKPVGAPPMMEANMSKAPPSTKLVPKPHSTFVAAAQALAAARAVSTDTTKASKPAPRPIKKPTAVIWDSADPFVVKPSVGTSERRLQGPGQAPNVCVARVSPASTIPATSTTSGNPTNPSAFGPPSFPITAPARLMSKPPSKRNADDQKANLTTASKKPCTIDGEQSPQPDQALVVTEEPPAASASASEEHPAVEVDEEHPNGIGVQGYQWPYNPYYTPYSYHPPPGWPYAPWNSDRPVGSATPGPEVPPFPPLHPGMPYPPPPSPGYYPPGPHTRHPANPAQGEPGPSRHM